MEDTASQDLTPMLNRRLLEPIGNIPPAEFEGLYNQSQKAPVAVAGLK